MKLTRSLVRATLALTVIASLALGATPQDIDGSILDNADRPAAERAQDSARKPIDLYNWLGIEAGMTVADLWPGGGYNSHLLSLALGEAGKVVTVWQFYADKEAFNGQLYQLGPFKERAAAAELTNVEIAEDFPEVAGASVDVALAVRNYHDIEFTFPEFKRADAVAQIFRILKPGGIVGVVDVATPHEGWDLNAHRLNKQVVIDDFTGGGFEFVGESDLLANPDDDYSVNGFPNRHLTDRYTLKFRKPAM
jgi:predicted methyltransferase